MITEDYVSFETAKLLKEKGFDSECRYVYNNDGEKIPAQIFMEGEPVVNNYDIERVGETDGWITYLQGTYAFLCPTIQVAMKWLREVHNMHVDVDPSEGDWAPCVLELEDWSSISDGLPICNSYEEACEMGIKYALENLI